MTFAASIAQAQDAAGAASDRPKKQLAELYQLQAAFHRAASVSDPVNGDSAAVIDQRIRDMLSLWTEDGLLVLAVGNPRDGNYSGRGDPADPGKCPTPSATSANRGTLCSFFKNALLFLQVCRGVVSAHQ